MAVICIDAGNTFVKVALVEQARVHSLAAVPADDVGALREHIRLLPFAEGGIICSVNRPGAEIMECLASRTSFCMELTDKTPIPVRNLYRTPDTLGKDRLAAVVGAYSLYPGKNVLVIDAGTALTFDFLDDTGNYRGGNISPGLQMRFRALHDYTQGLPLLEPERDGRLMGDSTHSAIILGIQNGIVFEMKHYICHFKEHDPEMIVVMTGGDINFFADRLETVIFAEPNLVHIGLEKIVKLNLNDHEDKCL
ncbi:MAG: type III pantothenate kinase [Bacteroidales bacterium]|nr:type III pantothenate kinase [Bacteroidales bacterium]